MNVLHSSYFIAFHKSPYFFDNLPKWSLKGEALNIGILTIIR